MEIRLVSDNLEMVCEWRELFDECKDVFIHHADYFSVPTDIFVSPANSFGFMDGGLDTGITKFFKNRDIDIEGAVKDYIIRHYNGELLVGQAFSLQSYENNGEKIKGLIVAPTMRVPMIIKDTVNVYLSARAIFLELKKIGGNHRVSIAGLGTGVGQVPYNICARQMKQAYDDCFGLQRGYLTFPKTWVEAQTRHQLLYSDEARDLQFKIDVK